MSQNEIPESSTPQKHKIRKRRNSNEREELKQNIIREWEAGKSCLAIALKFNLRVDYTSQLIYELFAENRIENTERKVELIPVGTLKNFLKNHQFPECSYLEVEVDKNDYTLLLHPYNPKQD